MAAWLDLIECGDGATCSLRVGDRVALPAKSDRDRHFVLGRTPQCDVMIQSRGQGGRRNCRITCVGNGHRLDHLQHGLPLEVAGRLLRGGHVDLRDGDIIRPGQNLALRYGTDSAHLSKALSAFGPLLLFDSSSTRQWRAVPRATPADEPCFAVMTTMSPKLAEEVAQESWSSLAPATAQMRAVVAGDNGMCAVLFDDVAGASLASITAATAAQNARIDPSIAFAIFAPVARVLCEPRAGRMVAENVVVTWSGAVRFIGLLPWRGDEDWRSERGGDLRESLRELASLIVDVVAPIDDDDDVLVIDTSEGYDEREERLLVKRNHRRMRAAVDVIGGELGRALANAIDNRGSAAGLAWALETQPAAASSELAAFGHNLFPDLWAAERVFREELAVLDDHAISGLLS